MILEPFLKSLLLIWQLPEFLGPKQLFFLTDFDDQSLPDIFNVLENFQSNYVGALTCERSSNFLFLLFLPLTLFFEVFKLYFWH